MIYVLYVLEYLYYVLYMCMGRKAIILWAGRRVSHGPEGIVQLTGRSGPGKAYVRKVYWGTH